MIPFPNKKYKIIYADPPWLYNDARTYKSTGMARSAYECMSLEEIKSLPVNNIADNNSLLFLWATMPKLNEALEVIKSWGFEYITCAFVWIKLNPTGHIEKHDKDIILKKGIYSGLGHWVNGNAELVLLGRKGKPRRILKNIKQIVIAPRREHSRKPDEVRNRITKLMGYLSRIELFARNKDKENLEYNGVGCLGK